MRVTSVGMGHRIACAVLLALGSLPVVACKKPKEEPRAEVYVDPPVRRRTVAPSCELARASEAGNTVEPTAACHADAECNAGLNGRCIGVYTGMGQRSHRCSYDECLRDEHCSDGKVCDCRTSAASSASSTCVAALCRTDDDCASRFCRFSAGHGVGNTKEWLDGWACRSPGDECATDADCRSARRDACVYQVSVAHFVCADRARN